MKIEKPEEKIEKDRYIDRFKEKEERRWEGKKIVDERKEEARREQRKKD